MVSLWHRLIRNIGGVTKILLTDVIWRPKNLLTIGGVGVACVQLYAGIGLLFAGSIIGSLGAMVLGVGGFFAGVISFFDHPISGGIALGMIILLILAGPSIAFGVADTTRDAATDLVESQELQDSDGLVNNSTAIADGPSPEEEDDVGIGYRDGDTAADGCGTNDGDPSINEDNDRDNDGLCDE